MGETPFRRGDLCSSPACLRVPSVWASSHDHCGFLHFTGVAHPMPLRMDTENLFFFFLRVLFVFTAWGLRCCVQAFLSSCSEQSYSLLAELGLSSCVHRLCCPLARDLPRLGIKPCPCIGRLIDHQGSPLILYFSFMCCSFFKNIYYLSTVPDPGWGLWDLVP